MIQFYQLASIVESAYLRDQPGTIELLRSLRAQVAAARDGVEAEIIDHAVAQLIRGQSIQTITVDGSAVETLRAFDVMRSGVVQQEPIPEPQVPVQVPAPELRTARKKARR